MSRSGHARRILAASGLSLLAAGAVPSMVAAQEDEAMSPEQVAAVVKPSVVYIGVTWTGYVGGWEPAGLPEKEDYWSSEIELSYVCSGFVVDQEGYVVTAGHCVDPDEVRQDFVDAALDEVAETGVYSASEMRELADYAATEFELEGLNDDSPLERTIDVHLTQAAAGIEVSQPFQAQLLEFRPLDEGDVALLKVHTSTPLPALELAEGDPVTGARVTSAGYPAAVGKSVDAGAEPSFKTGMVSSTQTSGGAPFIEIDASMSGGMSGGPTVDDRGRVVGINSWGPTGTSGSFNFVAATSSIEPLVRRYDIGGLADTDVAYREGLDAYFDGEFSTAVDRFDDVIAAIPSHAQAQHLRADAMEQDESSSGFPAVLRWLLVTLAVVGAAVGAVLVVRRHPAPNAVVTTIGCPSCGTTLDTGSRFCGGCGHAIAEERGTLPPPVAVPAEHGTVPV